MEREVLMVNQKVSLYLWISILVLLINSCSRPDEIRVAFIGDSIFSGFNNKDSIAQIYSKNNNSIVLDLSLPGQSISNFNIERLNKCKSFEPEIIFIELGANDFLLGKECTEELHNKLINIIDNSKSINEVKIVLVSFIDSNMELYLTAQKKYLLSDYKKMYVDVSEKQDVFLIENIWQEKFGKKNYMSDNYHPNLKGQKVIIKSLLKL